MHQLVSVHAYGDLKLMLVALLIALCNLCNCSLCVLWKVAIRAQGSPIPDSLPSHLALSILSLPPSAEITGRSQHGCWNLTAGYLLSRSPDLTFTFAHDNLQWKQFRYIRFEISLWRCIWELKSFKMCISVFPIVSL